MTGNMRHTGIRPRLFWLAKIVLPVAALGVAVAVPAYASGTHGPVTDAAVKRTALLSPGLGMAPLTAKAAAAAASTCVRYATKAGWANNGYFSGDLVTAAAICVAESAGHPGLYVCDSAAGDAIAHGEFGPGHPVNCPEPATVSYDRGLWQLNTAVPNAASNTCAFNPVCNAGYAYVPGSQRGTTFAPWSSYDLDSYPQFIDVAQTAVTALTSGTVTSALLGECLAAAKSAVGASVVVADCGSGAATQQWVITGGKLRSGSVCASIGSTGANPAVVLRKCAKLKTQQWAVVGHGQLRNLADGKCLTDPGSNLTAGTKLAVSACASPAKNQKNQIWWLP